MKDKRALLRFNVDIVDHCNLNCKCCGHFSPLAEKSFLSLDSFERDCKRLGELSNGEIERLELMGGEPLLHPQIIDLMRVSRLYFKGVINLDTNGILLSSQADDFFKACYDYDVSIYITTYPLKLNGDKFHEISKKHGIKIIYKESDGIASRSWYKNHRDLTGGQNVEKNFHDCKWGNSCYILEDGKLSTCVMPFKTKHFNRYYGEKFIISKSDYIDIHKAKSLDEIMDFLRKPIPFCRYCLPNNAEQIHWGLSSKKIEEWI